MMMLASLIMAHLVLILYAQLVLMARFAVDKECVSVRITVVLATTQIFLECVEREQLVNVVMTTVWTQQSLVPPAMCARYVMGMEHAIHAALFILGVTVTPAFMEDSVSIKTECNVVLET